MRVVAVETQSDEFRLCVDRARKLPGRGAWIHPSPNCIAQTIKRRVWARALKLSGTVDVSELNGLSEFLSDPSAGKRVEEVVEAR